MDIATQAPAKVRVRGRSFMALILAPEPPTGDWFAALDRQMPCAGDFFGGRPVIADLAAIAGGGAQVEAVLDALDGMAARGVRLIGVDGVDRTLLCGTRWDALPIISQGREVSHELTAPPPPAAAPSPAGPAAAARAPSLLIERPVRSGESILFPDGDLTVVGSVASGAEVIAGGSVHVYGALRGRAVAGLTAGAAARIFCRKLEAEMLAIDRRYRTAEYWGDGLHGGAVQVVCERGMLRISPLE